MDYIYNTKNGRYERLYQSGWVKGKVILNGSRSCSTRYNQIKAFCSKFERPISVFDLGANLGYFSIRLAEDFEGTFVMAESSHTLLSTTLSLLRKNAKPNTILLTEKFTLERLKLLAEVEHFDIVLGLSVVHHFSEPYQEVFDALTKLGSYLFFEHPDREESCIYQERVHKESIQIHLPHSLCCRTKSLDTRYKREMFLVECKENSLKRPCWKKSETPLLIKTDFHSRSHPTSITLSTFLEFEGAYPILDVQNLPPEPWNVWL